MTETEQKLRALVAGHLNRDADSITPGSTFGADLGADSFDVVALCMSAEELFEISLEDDKALDAFDIEKTFGDALALVEAKRAAKVSA